AQRLIWRSQRNMQPDRDPGFAGIENVERDRLGAIEIGSDYHYGGGIDPAAHDEITDCDIDRRRHAVIIGTQPDMSTRAVTPSINDIPVFHRGLPVYFRSKPHPAQELKHSSRLMAELGVHQPCSYVCVKSVNGILPSNRAMCRALIRPTRV